MQVSAQADQSVNALTTQLTGHAMLQLRLIKGAYSAEHLQHVARSSCMSFHILEVQTRTRSVVVAKKADRTHRRTSLGLGLQPPDSGKTVIFAGKSYIFRAEASSQKLKKNCIY